MRPDNEDSTPASQDVEPLWTVKDVADFLRVSRSWVYHRAEAGELPCLRIGALLRFEPERVRAYTRGERPAQATVVAFRKC
jgi:excisionase family DNA binding protein